MNLNSKMLATLGLIATVGVVIWLGFSGGNRPSQPLSPPSVTEGRLGRADTSSFFKRSGTANHVANTAVPQRTIVSTNLMPDWEDQIGQILGDDAKVEEKANRLLELFPRLPEAGQVEAANHISNLLADENFEQFGGYLTNAKTWASVQDVILADVLNRPNAIKLPLLLQTARTPDNAKAGAAKETLERYLGGDYGADWNKWKQEMEKWLKENPD